VTLFSNAFDSQASGDLQTGSGANQFAGIGGTASDLRVVSYYSDSAPNSLGVNVEPGVTAYADETYGANYPVFDLSFDLMVGPNFSLPTTGHVTIAGTEPSNPASTTGTVELNVNGAGQLFLTYWDSSGQPQTVATTGQLSLGSWRQISLQETANGAGAGTLSLYVDGDQVGYASGLDLGTQGVGAFAIGNIHTPVGQATSGQLYYDDMTASTTPADQVGSATPGVPFVPLPQD
jgi:hypothetical protein